MDHQASILPPAPQAVARRLAARRDLWLRLPWLLAFAGALGLQFWLGFAFNSNETTNGWLRVARGSAWALLVVLATLWLPVMRHSVSALRRSALGALLPLDHLKSAHRWLGQFFVALALAHGVAALGYLASLDAPFTDQLFGREPDLVRAMRTTMNEFVSDDELIDVAERWIADGMPRQVYDKELGPFIHDECGKCHSTSSTQTYAVPGMPLTRYEEVLPWARAGVASRQFRINASGLALLAIALTVWGFALARLRRRHHHLFQRTHRLGYLLAALLLLHVPSLQWLYLPLAVLAVEYYLSRYRRCYADCAAQLTPVHGNVVRLDIERPAGMALAAGHYVRLRIPALSTAEWHEFSLTGRPDAGDAVVLKIRCHGDWTSGLRALLGTADARQLRVDLRGPYASPAAQALQQREWVLVAGGIGITPFLSLIRELLQEASGHREFHLVWMLREPVLLEWVRPLVERLCVRRDIRCHWYFYLTDAAPGEPAPRWLERIQGEAGVRLRAGLPDWPELAAEIAAHSRRPACYVCGPDGMARDVVRQCRKRAWPVRVESF